MKKIIAILLLAVFVTATFALVVTSKQAKFAKVSPLFKRRVAWATESKPMALKTKYLEGRVFIWSFLRYIRFGYSTGRQMFDKYVSQHLITCIKRCSVPGNGLPK
ncbi:MAG TPA: hypothetical protein ENG74_03000 [Thermoplasmatales archaeon]|nr:hypothetical protein [Thermoplasmatales archaeon]